MNLGLRFILQSGGFLDVVLPADKAEEIVRNFETGYYGLKGIASLGGRCVTGRSWWVRRDDVCACHTERVDVKQIQSVLSGGVR